MSSLNFQGFIIALIRCFVSFFHCRDRFRDGYESLRKAFETVDTNRDGYISRHELQKVLFDFHYFLDDVQLNILLDRSVLITFAVMIIFLKSCIDYMSRHLNYPWICANRPLSNSWGGRAHSRSKDGRGRAVWKLFQDSLNLLTSKYWSPWVPRLRFRSSLSIDARDNIFLAALLVVTLPCARLVNIPLRAPGEKPKVSTVQL